MAERPTFVPESALSQPQAPEVSNAVYKYMPPLEVTHSPFSQDRYVRLPEGYNSLDDLYEGFRFPFQRERAGSTSLHESHHLLVAKYGFGIEALAVSRKTQRNSRGRNVFAGDLSLYPYGFMVTAAAGAVDTLHGSAEGHGNEFMPGSDISVAAEQSSKAGISIEEAIERAKKILDGIHPSIRQTVADIIETQGEIFGPYRIKQMIDIAEFETGNKIETTYIESEQSDEAFAAYKRSVISGAYTSFEDIDEGMQVKYGLLNDPESECPFCGQKGHEEKCSVKPEVKNDSTTQEMREDEEYTIGDSISKPNLTNH